MTDFMEGLRPRQVKAVNDITQAYRSGFCAPTLVMPTGGGKTHTAATIIRRALAKGKRVWFVAHLKEILQATAAKLKAEGVPHGWIAAGYPGNRKLPVQVVMIQTLARRLDLYQPPDLLIVDEAHLAVSNTYQTVFEWAKAGPKFYVQGGAHMLALTATACRLDGRGMGEISDIIVPTCSTLDLISEGLLVPVRYLTPTTPDMTGVHKRAGDYVTEEVADIMSRPSVTGSAVDTYLREGKGRPGIGFACDVKRANDLTALFCSRGIRAVTVCGDDDPEHRDWALRAIQNGGVDFVWNAKLWIAGVDAPSISYIADMAPTNSQVRYRQGIGRGLRICEGKTDLVYADHAGNYHRLGNPLAPIDFTLAGTARPGETQERAMSVRTCPKCFGHTPSVRPTCKHCGHTFELKGREIEERDGELEEIQLAAATETARLAARSEQGQQKDRDALVQLGKRKGYKNAEKWADYVLAGRAKKAARDALAAGAVKNVAEQMRLS